MKVARRLLSVLLVLTMLLVTPFTTGLSRAVAEDDKTEPPEDGRGIVLELKDIDPETLHAGNREKSTSERTFLSTEQEEPDPDQIVRVSIFLEDKSTIDQGYYTGKATRDTRAVKYRQNLEKKQKSIQNTIEKEIGHALDVQWNLTLLVNAISVNVPYKDIETIKRIPGVKSVDFENTYLPQEVSDETNTAITSEYMAGAAQAWTEGYTGAGSTIAILDTGIDATHISFDADCWLYALDQVISGGKKIFPMSKIDEETLEQLNAKKKCPTLTVDDTFVSKKIPFGFNYSQGNTDIAHNDQASNHGSHVAGIAAANRFLRESNDGYVFVDAAETKYAVGMAPDAQLIVMDVFKSNGGTSDGEYFAALEDAIILGCDAANLSLGSPNQGFTYSNGYQDVLNRLVNDSSINMVVAISAGNEGAQTDNLMTDLYIEDVSLHTGGSPGTFLSSICVASADNIGFTAQAITVGEHKFSYWETSYKNAPITSIAGTYDFVYIDGVGTPAEYAEVNEAVSLEDKVVIVNRGSLNFSVKGNNLISYHPKALLIANNESGRINMDLSAFTGTFPMVSFALEDANAIKAISEKAETANYTYYTGSMSIPAEGEIANGVTGTREKAVMSDFSSWGVPGSLIMKPEITAPGGNIWSVNGTSAASSDTGTGPDQYVSYSGTSMASPHIAGLAALVAQYIRENAFEEKNAELVNRYGVRAINQSLMMSTATPMQKDGNYVPILQQGAGLVEVSNAINAGSVIMMDDAYLTTATRAAADGKVKVELGDDPEKTGIYTYRFTVYNIEDVDLEFKFKTEMFTQDVYHLEYSDDQFNIDNDFMDRATRSVESTASYRYDGIGNIHDVNKNGVTDREDAQAILDLVTGEADAAAMDLEAADLDADGALTSYDARLLLNLLDSENMVVPAHGSKQVTVQIKLEESFEAYPNGAYIEGFTYVTCVSSDEEGVDHAHEHSIPILGFYGDYTDPSMFDCITDNEMYYGLSNKIPYAATYDANGNMINSNTSGLTSFIIDGTEEFVYYDNPYLAEDSETFFEEYLAVNTSAKVGKIYYNLNRNAGTGGYALSKVNGYGGEVIEVLSAKIKNQNEEGPFFYASQGVWMYNEPRACSINKPLDSLGLEEGDTLRVAYYALPELVGMKYADDLTASTSGMITDDALFAELIESNTLGKGVEIGYDFRIDNTAPEVGEAVLNPETGMLTLNVSDNERVAYIGLLSVDGSVSYANVYPGEKEATVQIDASEAIANAKTYVAILVGDYARNEVAKAFEVNDIDYEIQYVFVLADDFTDGEMYSIANVNAPGSGSCLNISKMGSRYTISAKSVSILEGNETSGGKPYYLTDGVSNWRNSQNKLKAYDRYLVPNNNGTGLTTNTTDSNNVWTWDAENHRLYMTVGENTYYICYNNGFKVTTTPSSVYLYKRVAYHVPIDVDPYKPTSIAVDPEELTLFEGQEATIHASVLPLTADPSVTWESSDPNIVAVDQNGHIRGVSIGEALITATSVVDENFQAYTYVIVSAIENNDINGIIYDPEANAFLSEFNTGCPAEWTKLHDTPLSADQLNCAVKVLNEDGELELYLTTFVNSQAAAQLFKVEDDFTLTEIDAGDGLPPYDIAALPIANHAVISYYNQLFVINVLPDAEGHDAFSWGWSPASASGEIFCVANDPEFWYEEDYPEYGICGVYYYLDEDGVVYGLLVAPDYGASDPVMLAETGIIPTINDSMYAVMSSDGQTTYLYWTHYNEDLGASELIVVDAVSGAVMQNNKIFGDNIWPVVGLYKDSDLTDLPEAPDGTTSRNKLKESFRITVKATEGLIEKDAAAIASRSRAHIGRNSLLNQGHGVCTVSEEAETLTIVLSESEASANGKFVVAPVMLEDINYISFEKGANVDLISVHYEQLNDREGTVTIAYATKETLAPEDPIVTLIFSAPCINSKIRVDTYERNKTFFDEQTKEYESLYFAGIGHDWSEPTYTWYGFEQDQAVTRVSCSATVTCKHNEKHTLTKTDTRPRHEITKRPTCEESGVEKWTATFNFDGQTFTAIKTIEIPPAGHKWGEPTYEWAEDNSTVTATRICAKDATHIETETVETVYAVIKEATLLEDGEGVYTATFANAAFEEQTKTVVLAKLLSPVLYGADVYSSEIGLIEDGEVLYRYDVRIKGLPEAGQSVNSVQIFVTFDHNAIALYKADGTVDWQISENSRKVFAVWASETPVTLHNDDVILSLYFKKQSNAVTGKTDIAFTENMLNSTSAIAFVYEGKTVEVETATEDGSITFDPIIYGDANCDGVVTSADAALILRALVGLSELSVQGILNGDVTGDGVIGADDASMILRYVVKLIDHFTVEEP